jgi:hypothetical protein
MRSVLPILLAAVLALAGIPHALCACGCSWLGRSEANAATRNPATSCPHCSRHQTRDDADDAEPAGRKPCRCGSCELRLGVMDRTAPTADISSSGTWHDLVDGAFWLPAVVADLSAPKADKPAFPSSALPVRALPILLGHLLL